MSNALLLKAAIPEVDIAVVADCCAGTSPEAHEAALRTMASCQVDVIDVAGLRKAESRQVGFVM